MEKQKVGGLMVLFGGTGDLAENAILPALYKLFQQEKLSEKFAVIAASRKELTDEEYRDFAREAIQTEDENEKFFDHLFYQATDNQEVEDFEQLATRVKDTSEKFGIEDTFIYYYSIPPSLYDETTKYLKQSGILDTPVNHRVMVEKPFGEDLDSAQEYFHLLKSAFEDEQIYLVDHFLGMSAIQNILVTRYYNPALEAIWNHEYIDYIQISMPENFSIGSRGSFYDENGALLDMFQNHILQTLATVTMDLPADFEAKSLNQNKLALLQSIPAFSAEDTRNSVVRGQYDVYRDEEDVPEGSNTETYIAIQLEIQSRRWEGVPVYVRTGKSVKEGPSVVDIVWKNPQNSNLETQSRVTFSLADGEGMSFSANQYDPTTERNPMITTLGPDKNSWENMDIPDAYENLLYDALRANDTYFTTFAQVKEQWRITDSIKKGWKEQPEPSFPNYQTGETGPKEADDLLAKNGHQWIYRN